jgi:hypothetical protein
MKRKKIMRKIGYRHMQSCGKDVNEECKSKCILGDILRAPTIIILFEVKHHTLDHQEHQYKILIVIDAL